MQNDFFLLYGKVEELFIIFRKFCMKLVWHTIVYEIWIRFNACVTIFCSICWRGWLHFPFSIFFEKPGAGLGAGFPGLQFGIGIGAGCGIGLGFGYGMGKGIAYDENQRHTNVGKLFQGTKNLPAQ